MSEVSIANQRAPQKKLEICIDVEFHAESEQICVFFASPSQELYSTRMTRAFKNICFLTTPPSIASMENKSIL